MRSRWLRQWLLVAILVGSPTIAMSSGAGEHGHARRIRYGFTVRNTSAEELRDVGVVVLGPASETATQRVSALRASHPYEIRRSKLGNQEVWLRLTLPPYATTVIGVDAVLQMTSRAVPRGLVDKQTFLAAEPLVEVDDPTVRTAAYKIAGTSPAVVAERITQFVAGHVRGSRYIGEPRGAAYAMRTGDGDCTEAMYLLVALARSRGIPARGMAGFVVESDAALHFSAYHNWAELYVNGAWRIADPSRGIFEESPSDYVALRVLGEEEGNTIGFRRAMALDPRVSVTTE